MDTAIAMAREIADAGTTAVVATPVLTSGDVAPLAAADDARAALVRALADEGVPLEVLPGAELTLDALDGLGDDALHACTLGGGGRFRERGRR